MLLYSCVSIDNSTYVPRIVLNLDRKNDHLHATLHPESSQWKTTQEPMYTEVQHLSFQYCLAISSIWFYASCIMKHLRLLSILSVIFVCFSLSAAQPLYQGHVQIQTDRFTFIYEPHDIDAVREILSISDTAYEQLAQLLDHRPKRPIPVVITSRPIRANGYYSPFPSKIIIYTTSPENRFLGARTSSWLQSVFIHELTHYFHLTAPVGPAKFLTPIFGPEVPAMNTLLMPGWWAEGITTYTESQLLPGGRGNSPTFAFTYEAPLLEDSMWSLSQGSYNSLNPPSGRIYTTGFLMVDHLMETYGEQAFAEINRRYALWPFFGLSSAYTSVTGSTPKELFHEAIREHAEGLAGLNSAFPRFSPHQLGDFSLPFVTEKGLIGQSDTLDGGNQVIRYTEKVGETEHVVSAALIGGHDIAVTQDGRTIYGVHLKYDTTHPANLSLATAGYSDLFRYDTETQKFSAITTNERLEHPAVSPDGSHIAAIQSDQHRWNLVAIDQESSAVEILYDHPNASVYQPNFSPDGTQIVFIETIDGSSALRILNIHTRESFLITPWISAEIHNPRFIDSDRIWFSSDVEGHLSLYEISLAKKDIYRIFSDGIGITGGIPYQDYLYYETYTETGYTLRRAPLAALEQHAVSLWQQEEPRNVALGSQLLPEATRYRDIPRFTLWLPFAMNVPELTAGATVMSKSLLGRHTLQVTGGYSFDSEKPVAAIDYQFTPGPFTLLLQAKINETVKENTNTYQQQRISAQLVLPVYQQYRPRSSSTVYTVMNIDFAEGPYRKLSGMGYLSWSTGRYARPRDYYGNLKTNGYAGMQVQYRNDRTDLLPVAMAKISGQSPVFDTHQIISLSIEAQASLSGVDIYGLSPLFRDYSRTGGDASALLTAQYGIPFGVVDLPIPYGGITGMGLRLHGQKLVHLIDSTVHWEESWFVGALLDASFTMGTSFTLSANAGLVFDTAQKQPSFIFSVNFANLFSANPGVQYN